MGLFFKASVIGRIIFIFLFRLEIQRLPPSLTPNMLGPAGAGTVLRGGGLYLPASLSSGSSGNAAGAAGRIPGV